MEDQTQVRMYDEAPIASSSFFVAEANTRLIVSIILWGAVVGLLTMGLGVLLRAFVVEPIACGSLQEFAFCASGGAIAFNAAGVIMAVIGTIGLLRMSAYRPLLIALASAVTLWGAGAWLGPLSWYEALVWLSLLYALAYGTFAWLLRIYNFPIALASAVLMVIAARVVLQL